MTRPVTAEYDAEEKTLRLAEPLVGVEDHARVQIVVTQEPEQRDTARPWLAFSGALTKEAGDELASLVNEMFPPSNEEDDHERE
jgi:hypothetical protein